MTPQHTPGPWKLEEGGGHASNRIVGSDSIHFRGKEGYGPASWSDQVCENLGELGIPGPDANIRLICAAPDMLAALESITGEAGFEGLPDSKQEAIYAAIAKAKGAP